MSLLEAFGLAGSHVLCLVGGVYLCYAVLAGRLLQPRKISVGKAADAERERYRVNRDLEDEGFVGKTLKGYELDREKFLAKSAGTMPINRPKGVNDEFSRARALASPGLQAPRRAEPGGVPQGTPQGDGATQKAPD